MEKAGQDLGSLIAWVKNNSFSLSLNSEKLAFIFALNELSDTDSRELQESDLNTAYRIVNEEFNVDVDNFTVRMNNLVSSLVDQRVLMQIRVGAFDDACYRLSPLAIHITQAYQDDRAFSKIKITLLLSAISAKLDAILSPADGVFDAQSVHNELRFSVKEDLGRVDLVQRNMDEEQSSVKNRITDLLRKNWDKAIDDCTSILRETASKIKEVSEVLSIHSDRIHGRISDIEDLLSDSPDHFPIYQELDLVRSRVDRICRWGEISFQGWVSYDTNLQGHIRKIISVDPSKRLSERLLKKIVTQDVYGLCVTLSDRLVVMRETSVRNADKVIKGKLREKEESDYSEIFDLDKSLRSWLVSNIVVGADIDIGLLVREAVKSFSEHDKYLVAQKVVLIAQEFRRPSNDSREPGWIDVVGFGQIKAKLLDKANKPL